MAGESAAGSNANVAQAPTGEEAIAVEDAGANVFQALDELDKE